MPDLTNPARNERKETHLKGAFPAVRMTEFDLGLHGLISAIARQAARELFAATMAASASDAEHVRAELAL